MTQEDKDLLLKDLCARLPYGVKCKVNYIINNETTYGKDVECECIDIIKRINFDTYSVYTEWLGYESDIEDVKPYLRPLSSMTEEECMELSKIRPFDDDVETWKYVKTPVPLTIANIKHFDFFYSHHLDWRGLIEKGLAIAVTAENNPYKE